MKLKSLFIIFTILLLNKNLSASNPDASFYISLRSDEVNLRSGPGNEYPIKYVYQIKNIPLKVIGEYDNWYRVQDKDNDEGWVSKNLTIKTKYLIVVNGTQIMYKKNNLKSNPIFRLEENVIVKFNKCADGWCKIEVNDKNGWMESNNLWGYEI